MTEKGMYSIASAETLTEIYGLLRAAITKAIALPDIPAEALEMASVATAIESLTVSLELRGMRPMRAYPGVASVAVAEATEHASTDPVASRTRFRVTEAIDGEAALQEIIADQTRDARVVAVTDRYVEPVIPSGPARTVE